MNQGRIWCVVNPTVGLPLFIGGVAVTALVVHASVMSHTTWMSSYWEGGQKAKAASVDSVTAPVASNVLKTDDGYTITVAPVADAGSNAVNITVTPSAPKVLAAK